MAKFSDSTTQSRYMHMLWTDIEQIVTIWSAAGQVAEVIRRENENNIKD